MAETFSQDTLLLTSATTLEWNGKVFKCRTGRGGIKAKKVEGDGATPIGDFPLRRLFYRPDRTRPFACDLKAISLTPVDGWCDDPTDPSYNTFIRTPYPASHERLWREDHVYDFIIVVGYNDEPVTAPKGSAIFIHLMNEKQTPTEGCIALSRRDFIEILSDLSPTTKLVVPARLENKPSSSFTKPISDHPQ